MFNVITCHNMLKLTGTIRRTIVTLQLVGDSMRGEVSLQGSNHFIASLILELVDFEVAGIVIYGAGVISVFTVEDIASDCFPWTVWNFVRDKWFLLLIFLVSSARATLCYVVRKVSIQARPINCFTRTSKAAFNSCVGTMESLVYLGPKAGRNRTTHLKPLKRIPSYAVSSSLTVK